MKIRRMVERVGHGYLAAPLELTTDDHDFGAWQGRVIVHLLEPMGLPKRAELVAPNVSISGLWQASDFLKWTEVFRMAAMIAKRDRAGVRGGRVLTPDQWVMVRDAWKEADALLPPQPPTPAAEERE